MAQSPASRLAVGLVLAAGCWPLSAAAGPSPAFAVKAQAIDDLKSVYATVRSRDLIEVLHELFCAPHKTRSRRRPK